MQKGNGQVLMDGHKGGWQPSEEHRGEVARYLQRVVAEAGYRSHAELAREAGVAASSVSHWLSPTSKRGISAHNMLTVLKAAERRKAGVSQVSVDDPVGRMLVDLGRRLGLLEVKVDDAGANVLEVLRQLERRLARVEKQLGQLAPASTKRRAQ